MKRIKHFSQAVVVLNWLQSIIGTEAFLSADVRMGSWQFDSEDYKGKPPTNYANVTVAVISEYADYDDEDDSYQQRNEQRVLALLDKLPTGSVTRIEGRMYITGTTDSGVTWSISCGQGVCRKIVVDTVKRTRPDPELVKSLPTVDVYEPVYKYVCDDPLLDVIGG